MIQLTSPLFVFEVSATHRDLPSFPTRRSSDLRCNRTTRHLAGPVGHASWITCTAVVSDIKCLNLRDRAREYGHWLGDRKSTRLNSSHTVISYAVFCLKKKKQETNEYANKVAMW